MAEALVIIWLLVRCHRILAWRWKCHAGEIDLVARRGRTICFFEVKYLRRHDVAAAPSPRQQQRIIRAAEDFANRRRISRNLEWRFDLVQVGWLTIQEVAIRRLRVQAAVVVTSGASVLGIWPFGLAR